MSTRALVTSLFLRILPLAVAGMVLACGDGDSSDGVTPASRQRPDAPADSSPVGPNAEIGALVRTTLAEHDQLQRTSDLAQILLRSPPEALPAILQAYDESALDGGDLELVLLADWWARFDPQAAYRWTSTDWRAEYGRVLAAVFRAWARSEPEEALAHANRLRFSAQREMCVLASYVGWDESGKPGLVEFVAALQTGPDRQNAIAAIARRRVVRLGAKGAMEWAESLTNAGFKALAVGRVASAVAEIDPKTAAAWAEDRITSGDEPLSGLPRRIGTRWIKRDPEAAFAWLLSLPAGKDRKDGVTESFRDWMSRERDRAIAWIEAAQMKPSLEPAFGVYARAIVADRPREAVELARQFSDKRLRDMITTVVLRNWIAQDRENAEVWLAQAEIPDDVLKRAYMLRTLPNAGRAGARAAK